VRYYLYLSRAKLDMLHGQIPEKLLRRLAVEAKLDLKVVSVSMQSPRAEVSEYDRLKLVEAYLEREFDVSWISEPASWFRGDLELRIAGYGSARGPVFMTGSEGDTVVALIGSAHHLVGQQAVPEFLRTYSSLPSLFHLLRDAPEDWPLDEPWQAGGRRDLGGERDLRQVVTFARSLKEPATYCEFLARRLLRGTLPSSDGRELEVVVGTPLYVALADGDEGEGS
jgi:hypothetical protein